MARTIKEMIDELSAIENQDQPILFEYLLAENFEYADGTPSPTPEQFGEIIDKELSRQDFIFASGYEVINDIVYVVMREFVCYECSEPISSLERVGNDGLCDSCQQLQEENTNG